MSNNIDAEGRTITSVSEMDKLNEAIEWSRDMAYGDFCNMSFTTAQRYENISNWLEDYKDYRNANFDLSQVADNRYKEGYAMAIDDFAERLHDLCGFEIDDIRYPYLLYESRIDEIAEQLKNGDCADFKKEELEKTGQTVDIQHILEQIRGNE